MSPLQFGTLKYIRNNDIDLGHVRILNMGTLGSLLLHEWVNRSGSRIVITSKGEEAYFSYAHALPSERKREGDVSSRVSVMLKLKISKGAA